MQKFLGVGYKGTDIVSPVGRFFCDYQNTLTLFSNEGNISKMIYYVIEDGKICEWSFFQMTKKLESIVKDIEEKPFDGFVNNSDYFSSDACIFDNFCGVELGTYHHESLDLFDTMWGSRNSNTIRFFSDVVKYMCVDVQNIGGNLFIFDNYENICIKISDNYNKPVLNDNAVVPFIKVVDDYNYEVYYRKYEQTYKYLDREDDDYIAFNFCLKGDTVTCIHEYDYYSFYGIEDLVKSSKVLRNILDFVSKNFKDDLLRAIENCIGDVKYNKLRFLL